MFFLFLISTYVIFLVLHDNTIDYGKFQKKRVKINDTRSVIILKRENRIKVPQIKFFFDIVMYIRDIFL